MNDNRENDNGMSEEERDAREREIDELFYDHREARIWKQEGLKHLYLYWIRAMVTREVDEPPFETVKEEAPAGGEALLRLAVARAGVYSLIAGGFTEPTHEFAAGVESGAYRAALEEALAGWRSMPLIAEGLADLAAAEKTGDTFDHLLGEYTRIFLDTYLPFVPMYESVFQGERQVLGERAEAVAHAYAEMGLGVEGTELPDHIMHECEFLDYLAGREAAARQAGDMEKAEELLEKSRRFLEEHLLTWGTKFCRDVRAVAKSPLYLGLAKIAQGFFSVERALIPHP